jgi:hypothetical protein
MTARATRLVRLRSFSDAAARCVRVVAALALIAAPARAQSPDDACEVALSGPDFVGAAADLSRVLDLLGSESRQSFLVRRISDRMVFDPCGVPGAIARLSRSLALPPVPERGAVVLPAHMRIIMNGDYPRDWHDGAQWSGRGWSVAIMPGATFRWNWLEAAVAPQLMLQQNETFPYQPFPDSAAYSRYADRWHGRFIDLPQRFGAGSFSTLDAGPSYVRAHFGGWRAGVSNENLAWGPARRNPLLLSGTAAGFPHLFLETSRPRDVLLGMAELQLFWGRLAESDYFDRDPDNDHRLLSAALVTLRPHGLEGLYLGVSRLHSQTWSRHTSADDLFLGPFTGLGPDASGFPRDLRLYGLFMRWAAAPGGFEVYGEWARQDDWRQWLRLRSRTDASQAYTLGLQKIVRRGDNAVRLSAEVSSLADNLAHADVGRGVTTFYVSPYVVQGHTHRGQLLGAPIGPGSEAQFIGADLFWSRGRSSLSVERVRYDDDAYYATWYPQHRWDGHDTELSFRAGHLLVVTAFSIEAEIGYSMRYNRALLGLGPVFSFPYRRDTNVGLRLSGRWNPPNWPGNADRARAGTRRLERGAGGQDRACHERSVQQARVNEATTVRARSPCGRQ